MLRKGRAGGDVYEDIDRKFFSATDFGDYNRNYWAKKIKENRSGKNLSAKLRLRELAYGRAL
jgi:hypothetical protein